MLQWPGSSNERSVTKSNGCFDFNSMDYRRVWGYELMFGGFDDVLKPARDASQIGWDSSLLQFIMKAENEEHLTEMFANLPSTDAADPWAIEDYELKCPRGTLVKEEPPVVRARLSYLRKNKLVREATNLSNFVALQVYHSNPTASGVISFSSTAFKYLKAISRTASITNTYQIVQKSLELLKESPAGNVPNQLINKFVNYWTSFLLQQYQLSRDSSTSAIKSSKSSQGSYISFRTSLRELCERKCGQILIDAENQKEAIESFPDRLHCNLILETTVQLFVRVISKSVH